ncbi:alpha-N-acetylglucosaminidase, putative [Talaromyces stipitatus ATCC 10500]|uniref:Alpha-N-acetylglucosaminidase, putative n=1 Tax=Talaromyces stipitatus (strain ATCC 10500 / CBS 375.48 / QM 6759 / NRRL 1006) TaxID=441959 RepID=B8MKH4_TALSN|nr:alpha-N-acetylglucosaminidase, putative [Talaromyces stipitatus ATCC 10500]EED15329.1 alpha-N-acetylglucosaminidase, putative [Talaromyces stipitatus ATCC 10500]
MQIFYFLSSFLAISSTVVASCTQPSASGIEALLQRRLPQHADKFEFGIVNATSLGENDVYVVLSAENGSIRIEGSSLSALATGLHRYLSDVAHVDIYWFIGSRLDQIDGQFPKLNEPLTGSSVVPYRYHFNTVTTSYTSAFWSWEDWELQLDWMALRGINLPLAWIGIERIFIEVFQDLGLTDTEIADFLSGPAFLAWNHFGNIQGSWSGSLPYDWVDSQFDLQKKIVKRMTELGMTPILPAFPGFVPRAITRVLPDADVINGSAWEAFPTMYTNDTFMEPTDPHFTEIQKSFIAKQIEAYGNVTTFYTLDQFNENNPSSGDLSYLRNVSQGTWKTLKAADSNAVWVMQGWLFTSNSAFWTNDRIEAYLGGVAVDSDLLILDLASESSPQWQRTNSYYGKPWIWCEIHDYGGNMGFYGQVMNITNNPIAALHNSSSLVGFGLSMEGQEGNEIVYDLLLDQAWNAAPIDTESYFHDWVTARYAGSRSIPSSVYSAWDILRTTVYNNTNLAANAVPKAIFELIPSTTGLLNRTGHHPTKLNYNTADMVQAWNLFYTSAFKEPSLWLNPAFEFDLVDMSRQVLANAFIPVYENLISTYNTSNPSSTKLQTIGAELIGILQALDTVLATNKNFKLSTWLSAARASAGSQHNIEDFLEYNARNQITLWGPTGQISDYASKSWAGLVSSYYIPRWKMFVEYLIDTPVAKYNQSAFNRGLLIWELQWQNETIAAAVGEEKVGGSVESVLEGVVGQWKDVFSS